MPVVVMLCWLVVGAWVAAGQPEETGPPPPDPVTQAVEAVANDYVAGVFDDAARVQAASHPLLAKRRVATEFWGEPSRAWLKTITHEQLPSLVAYLRDAGPPAPDAPPVEIELLSRTDRTAAVRARSALGVQLLHLARFDDGWLVVDDAYALDDGDADSGDERAIASTLRDYARGFYAGDPARVLSACHSALAKRELVVGENGATMLRPVTLEELGMLCRAYASYWGFDMRNARRDVEFLAVTPSVASVRLEGETWTDLIHLAKLDDRWLITDVLTLEHDKPTTD